MSGNNNSNNINKNTNNDNKTSRNNTSKNNRKRRSEDIRPMIKILCNKINILNRITIKK